MTGFERFRRKNLLTQTELAELLGLSVQAVCRWEKGDITPTVSTLQRLSVIYDVRMEDLLRKDYPDSGLEEIRARGA